MENEKIRTSRASQTRAKSELKKVWTPPNSLDAPPAPTGYRHQWLRSEILGQMDTKNIASSLREGWELVRADEYPEENWPTMNEGRYAGVIGQGGLVLARIPEEILVSRAEYFDKITQDRMNAVDNDLMKEQHPDMPINIDRQSKVTFGGGSKK